MKYLHMVQILQRGFSLKTISSTYQTIPILESTTTTTQDILNLCRAMASSSNDDQNLSAAFVTCPDDVVAKKLAGEIVRQKLAACVNIIPSVTSVYEWQGKVEQDSEVLLMIKTRSSLVEALSTYVRENHPYDVAEVIATPIEGGNPPYLEWVRSQTKIEKKSES